MYTTQSSTGRTATTPQPTRPDPDIGARRPWWTALAAAPAGLVMWWSFPPHGSGWGVVAGAALMVAVCRRLSLRTGLLAGLVFGLTFFVPLLRWSGVFVGAVPWLLLAVTCSVLLAPLGALLVVARRAPAWPLAAAGAWVAVEAVRDRFPFGGFPWGDLAFAAPGSPWAGLARWGGAPLVTFGLVLTAALLVDGVERLARRDRAGTALLPVLLAAGVTAAGPGVSVLPDGTRTTGSTVVAAVQGNVPRAGLEEANQAAQVTVNHTEATEELAAAVEAGEVPRPDLVLWPENATDVDPFLVPGVAALLDRATAAVGVPVLVGAVLEGPDDTVRNAGVVWTRGTGERGEQSAQVYVKQHPVPFGEYIPLRSVARRISSKVDLVPRDFAAGDEVGLLDIGGVAVGDVICFEVAYSALVRDTVRAGAQLLVVQTNNATFGDSGETEQQLAMSRLRAVETGRPVVVVATSGISAVIAPDGQLLESTDLFTRAVLVHRLPLVAGQTPATRLGAAPELGLVVLALALVLVGRRREARMRP